MEATRQPVVQTTFCTRNISLFRANSGVCHANLGKSKFLGPGPDFGQQQSVIDLNVGRHGEAKATGTAAVLPIVETRLWRNEAATQAAAQALAAAPAIRNAFITLQGDLGAGKTTLVRHLLRAMGVQGRVKSPTYAVVEPYELEADGQPFATFAIWHFDFYRFNDPKEWADAGFRDIFASPGLKVAEWPQNAAGQLPLADLELVLAVMDDECRQVTVSAHTAVGQQLLNHWQAP